MDGAQIELWRNDLNTATNIYCRDQQGLIVACQFLLNIKMWHPDRTRFIFIGSMYLYFYTDVGPTSYAKLHLLCITVTLKLKSFVLVKTCDDFIMVRIIS
jgi:hypothetical protein